MNRRLLVTARRLAIAGTVIALAACGDTNGQGEGDTTVDGWDDTPAFVINMPDRFHNIAFKCHGPNGVYAHTRDAPPVIIPNDGNCTEGDR